MKPVQLTENSNLSPIEILKALKASGLGKAGAAIFRVSEIKDASFSPVISIIGVDPVEILRSRGGETTLVKGNKIRKLSADPFHALQLLLSERRVLALPDFPSFQGGALGYLSYEASRFTEPTLNEKPTFSNQRTGYDAELVFFRMYVLLDHRNGTSYLISETPKGDAARVVSILKKFKPRPASKRKSTVALNLSDMSSNLGKIKFISAVKKLKTHILDGNIFQAVLSDQFTQKFSGDGLDLFETLAGLSPAPYQFYLEIEGRTYLGASPEMLLKSEKDQIETHPIAGTRPRGKDSKEEAKQEKQLVRSIKERAEHLMLVDLARNDLGRVAKPGSVKVDSFMKVRKFGGVMHLVSKVSASLASDAHALQALASCFPAGTLSGAPKIRAMELISDLEGKARGFYGGAFIAASLTGELDSCITIRGISIENETATIQVGAGIVADSVPEKEYAEIEHKSRMTRQALAEVSR